MTDLAFFAMLPPLLAASTGLGIGLLVGALLLGLRHGIDWDHIAAISDLSATQDVPRRGLGYGLLYALGHSVVVLLIGLAAIAAGRSFPEWLDAFFGRVVGATLVLLGVYVLWSLWRHRQGFRMQSRWMLLIGGIKRLVARVRPTGGVTHEHPHAPHEDLHHEGAGSHPAGTWRHTHGHSHPSGDIATEYGAPAALVVGMLHGVGAETPTQVVAFLAASQAGGTTAGVAVLIAFIAGLLISNMAITVATVYGFRETARRQRMQVVLGGITAVVSLVVGMLFLLGRSAALPGFFGG